MTDIEYTPGPLLTAARTTRTALWNDSADLDELRQSISFGGVGATCNPVIAYTVIRNHMDVWVPRILAIAEAHPTWGESEIGWQAVKDLSVEAAVLLEGIFAEHKGRNGRLSMQTDPRFHRDAKALADQAVEFHGLAENIVVKIPATRVGIAAIEDATYRGVSVNVTVSFSVAQAVRAAEAIERGLDRRAAEGHDISRMGPVVTVMVGRLDDWLKAAADKASIAVYPPALDMAGVACVKKAYKVYKERGYGCKMLAAAYRTPLHWLEFIGGDVVLTMPYKYQVMFNNSDFDVVARMDEEVDPYYIKELRKLPDFVKAYDHMEIEEFDTYGVVNKTLDQFAHGYDDLVNIIRKFLFKF